jgi:molybdenum cofactor cytidylyltransferase
MRFGPVPPADAAGAILAHSTSAGPKRFKKGHRLSAEDTEVLAAAGLNSVVVCRLEDGDIEEDRAADRLAEAVTGSGLGRSAAFTGRVNLTAEADGILVYDLAALDAINRIDEGITLAALPPFSRVAARQMVATAKIIPFAVPEEALRTACPHDPLLRVAPFRAKRLGLIQTELPETKPKVLDKTDQVMAARAAALGAAQQDPRRCPHDSGALAAALRRSLEDGADIVTVVGASAIVDRRDVIPAAIEAAGGTVHHFGMPVDPGNLLLLGEVDGRPVIGAPGCVRSPKPNGYDWVLERLAADLPVDRDAIMAMGSGGFLKEIPSRPLPRIEAEAEPGHSGAHARALSIHAILLAAGQSRRMGPENKLLADLDGKPMVRHAAEALDASQARGITVITGHEADAVRAALDGLNLAFAQSPLYAQGLAETVKRGAAAVPEEADGALFALGDMPRVRPETLDKLIAAFDPVEGRAICVPVHNGKRGNPVLFARRFFPEIMELSGDSGAKALLGAYEEQVCEVAVDDPGVLLDLDTPDALTRARRA